MKRFVLSSLALLAVACTFAASAHTGVKSAKPPNEAVLDSSPPAIEIAFEHAVQMTSVVVTEADKSERKLAFAPTTGAALITIDKPGLHAGRNEIRWKALSRDGHVIDGTLVYVVKAANASP